MGRVRMKLNELVDGDAQFISLVGKGANRQPIKIMKSDEEEISMDWTKFFHNKDAILKAEITPEILAVGVAPGVDLEVVKAILDKADLKTDDVREIREGDELQATFFVQDSDVGVDEGKDYQTVVQLADGVSAVCLVAQKSFQPFAGSTSFSENLKSQGFFPGLHLCQAVLEDTVFEIAMDAANPVDMAQMIKTATEEFSAAVQAMTKVLPAQVFKLEDLVRKGSTTGGPAPGEDPTVGRGDTGEPAGDLLSNEKGAKSSIEPMGSVQKAQTKVEDTGSSPDADMTAGEEKAKGKGKKKDDDEGADAKATADGEGAETAAKEDPLADIKELLGGLSTKLEEGLAEVQKKVTELGTRVTAAERVATKAEEATRGRVSATAPEDDGLNTVTKREVDFGAVPLLDTGMQSVVD